MGRICKLHAFDMKGVVWKEANVLVGRKMYASFGGLLMFLEGPYRKLTSLRVDDVYLLIKK